MKIIFLSLFISLQIFAQTLLLFDGISYNGTELITNTMDKDFEPVSVYSSDFSAGVNGWDNLWGTIAGNIDGVWGQDNVARILADGSGAYSYLENAVITANVRYAGSALYYIQAAGGTDYVTLIIGASKVLDNDNPPTKGTWTELRGNQVCDVATQTRMNFGTPNSGDSVYFRELKLSKITNLIPTGNHSTADSSSDYKQGGSYSVKLIASGAGNGTTNTFSLASTKFTAVTNGSNYRFQVYAYTSTANTTLTFKLGDIVKTAIVSTIGMSVINFDFKATASSTGNLLLYLDKAATVYIDNLSLRSGQ